MRNIRFGLFVLFAVLLSACSTTPRQVEEGAAPVHLLFGTSAATSSAGTSLSPQAAGDVGGIDLFVREVQLVRDDEPVETLVSFDDPVEVDLLELQDGIQLALAEVRLPAGDYQDFQLRLVLADATIDIEQADGSIETLPLKTPSAEQSGLKFNVEGEFEVDETYGATIVFTFDAGKKVVQTGNGRYILKPTYHAELVENARLRVVHASADAPAVDVSLDGLTVAELAYGEGAEYTVVPASASTLVVREAATGEPVFEGELELSANTDYTLVATGLLSVDGALAFEPLLYIDGSAELADGETGLRFIHASTGLAKVSAEQGVDVYATAPEAELLEAPLVSGLGFGELAPADSEVFAVSAGTYRLRVTRSGSTSAEDVLIDTAADNPTFDAGASYTVIAIGDADFEKAPKLLILND